MTNRLAQQNAPAAQQQRAACYNDRSLHLPFCDICDKARLDALNRWTFLTYLKT